MSICISALITLCAHYFFLNSVCLGFCLRFCVFYFPKHNFIHFRPKLVPIYIPPPNSKAKQCAVGEAAHHTRHKNCESFQFYNMMKYSIIPLRRLKVVILKWPIPLANFYLNSGQFLRIVANSSNF